MLRLILILSILVSCLITASYADDGDETDCVCITSTDSDSSTKARKPRCGKNERWVNCAETLCIPLECSQVGFPVPCPILGPNGRCPRPARCICIAGYVRNCKGKCIPQKQCPSCGGDENAVAGCGHQCGTRCGDKVANSTTRPQPCACRRNACDCKKGYVYDDKQSMCVRPGQCPKSTSNPTTPGTCSVDETLQLLQQGNAVFTGKCLYEAYKITPDLNMIMSPFSVFIPIGELALYSRSETLVQFLEALNLPNKDAIKCVFPALTSQLRAEKEIILNLAARIFSTDKYPLTQNFLDDTKNIFDAEAESINFLNANAAADRINAWVANETNDRIKDIATPDMFNEDTRLVLANAIYFLGNWVTQFNPNNTENRQFNISSTESVQIPTMYQESRFNYAEVPNLDCKILEMSYKGGNFSFVVFLPNSADGLSTLIKQLLDPTVFYSAYNSTNKEKVQVYLPKMKIESEYDLVDLMGKIGITDVFDADKSNLTDILQVFEPLYISAAKQKAFCEVDETGTEAAAANVFVGATTTSVGFPTPVYIFDANRPFVFYILHNTNILFCGTFVKNQDE